jgi:uncharacterized protein (TIGR03083 family)
VDIHPRYASPAIIEIDGTSTDMLEPVSRQHRRFAATLESLTDEQWRAPSRCAEWSVKDVVAHLAGVNEYWAVSITAGLAGEPTRYLSGFDPVSVPAAMVAATDADAPEVVHSRFRSASDRLVELLGSLSMDQWDLPAEAPPGWLPIRLVANHALWDAWTHERDIDEPLGRPTTVIDDEVAGSLRYVCALSGALSILLGQTVDGPLSLHSTGPDVEATVTIDQLARVQNVNNIEGVASLCGDAVDLLDALSFRAPMPSGAPEPWRQLMGGLATFFNTTVA